MSQMQLTPEIGAAIALLSKHYHLRLNDGAYSLQQGQLCNVKPRSTAAYVYISCFPLQLPMLLVCSMTIPCYCIKDNAGHRGAGLSEFVQILAIGICSLGMHLCTQFKQFPVGDFGLPQPLNLITSL